MTEKLIHMLRGAGSVMDMSPGTNYKKFVSQKNVAKRMEGHWARVGRNIQTAINRFSNDQKTKK